MSDETVVAESDAAEFAVVQWVFMGNRPGDNDLRFPGDRDRLPVDDALRLRDEKRVMLLSDDAEVFDTTRDEISVISGYNVPDFVVTAIEAAQDALAKNTVPRQPRKGGTKSTDSK